MREELTKVEAPLSPSSTICALITGDGNLSLSISKDEIIKTGNQFLQRKVKLLLTEDEIRSFTHLVYYIEPFLQWRKQNVKNLAPLSPSSTICALITGDGNLSLSISKDETIKTGNQFLQRKVKLLLTEDEIRSFTHLVYYIEPFLQWRKQNVKNSTQSLSSETLTDVETPGW